MAAGRLTTRSLHALRAEAVSREKNLFLWDTEVRGFGAVASPKGAVSFIIQKWLGGRGGKSRRIVIGRFPEVPVANARIDAGKKSALVREGFDLVNERKLRREALREKLTTELKPTIELYLKRKGQPGEYWKEIERVLLKRLCPILGPSTPLASISKAQLRDLIEMKQETHPGAARNMFAALRPFFSWCVERDLIPASPLDNITPPAVLKARNRILTLFEIKVFWEASVSMGYPFGDIHRLLLLTAQRRDEVGGMRRSELDLDKGEWIIPAERTKNAKEHLVHLSPQAIDLIKSLPNKGDLVFTTTGKTPVSGYSNAKEILDAKCAKLAEGSQEKFLPDFRIHDLRRTAASGMAELGFQPHIVERVLNHISGAQGGLVGVYQRFEYAEERRKAILAWANHVDTLLTGEKRHNVIPLRSV